MTAVESEWAERVSAWKASGRSARAFCEDKAYSMYSLRYWSKRLGGSEGGGIRLARVTPIRPTSTESVPVAAVQAPLPASVAAPRVERLTDEPIVVEVGKVRIVVRRGFDAQTLAAVITALGGGR